MAFCALRLASGIELIATADDDRVVPGQAFTLTLRIWNGGRQAVYRDHLHYVNRLDLGREELFDIRTDQLEQNDLASLLPATVDSLREVLRTWIADQQTILSEESGHRFDVTVHFVDEALGVGRLASVD